MTDDSDDLGDAVDQLHSGNLDAAESLCRKILHSDPKDSKALHIYGLIWLQRDQPRQAEVYLREAISCGSQVATLYSDLGEVLNLTGFHKEALKTLDKAQEMGCDKASTYNQRGVALAALHQFEAALEAYDTALEQSSDFTEVHFHRGNVLNDLNRYEEAITSFDRVLKSCPQNGPTHVNRGFALYRLNRIYEAEIAFKRSIECEPAHPEAYNGLTTALLAQGKIEEALEARDRAVTLWPRSVDARFNRACTLLLIGDYQKGWQEYKWRLKTQQHRHDARVFTKPVWEGKPIEEASLLLYTEQGAGDAIQFIRYATKVAKRLGKKSKILIECPPKLKSLFGTISCIKQIVDRGKHLPHYDCHASLMDLPRIFATTEKSIPAKIPYLSPPPHSQERISALELNHQMIAIGVVWAGRSSHPNDRRRSIPIQAISALLGNKDCQFVSLQVGPGTKDLQSLKSYGDIIDPSPWLTDYAETAALIDRLDLVISVDTSVAHLAGALGKPVWTLLAHNPDWRWQLNREDTPWYPTMRLFRQDKPGDWDGVIERVMSELEFFVASHTS